MDRRRTTPLLTALYGMDTRSADWAPVLSALGRVFKCNQTCVAGFASRDLAGAPELLQSWDDGVPSPIADRSQIPWFLRAVDRLVADGIADRLEHNSANGHAVAELAPITPSLALRISADSCKGLTVLALTRHTPSPDFDDDDRALARSLLPHLRNVCAWQQRFHSIDHEAERFRTALDSLTEGVLMLDGEGRPVFCNTAARKMACHHLFSWRSDGRLGMTTSGDEHQLQHTLRELSVAGVSAPRWLPIHGSEGDLVATLKLCPTPPAEGASSPVQMIAFIKPLEPVAAPTLVPGLKAQWGLTSAEAQLAQQLMHGHSLDEAARHIHVSKNTVRTQLRSLFMKTDTHRQAELVRVLLKLSHV